jgi:hypothetical protein
MCDFEAFGGCAADLALVEASITLQSVKHAVPCKQLLKRSWLLWNQHTATERFSRVEKDATYEELPDATTK